jgi:hypothetical protein
MLKTKDPEKWEALQNMEALEGTRRPKLQRRKAKALCALLTARFGLPATEKEMMRLLAVLEVNAYEVSYHPLGFLISTENKSLGSYAD